MNKLTPRGPTPDFHNPWRESLENCISGDNYLRAQEYSDLIEELDDLYRLRAMHDAAPTVEAQPVAWMDDFGNAFPLAANKGAGSWLDEHKRNWKPLYTHPAAPQPAALPELSDAEIGRLVDRMDNTHDSDLLKFARAVIAAMKGKQ